jgi:hypothetical protein
MPVNARLYENYKLLRVSSQFKLLLNVLMDNLEYVG